MKIVIHGGENLQLPIKLTVFDFDTRRNWNRVLAVSKRHFVLEALDLGMMAFCADRGKEWSRKLGPWYFSDHRLVRKRPTPKQRLWYRGVGDSCAISPWSAAVGQALYPEHEWLVAYGFWNNLHSAGIGLRERDKSVIIMDLFRGGMALKKFRERALLRLLMGQSSFAYPIKDTGHSSRRLVG